MSWNVRIRLGLLVLVTVVLQTELLPDLRLLGVVPDLGLVATIAVAYRLGSDGGALYGFANGLAIDVFLQTPLGLSALSFAVVGYGVGILQSGLSREPRFAALLFGGVGGLAGGALFVALAALTGEDQVIAYRTIYVLVVAAIYDALLAVVMFPVARWATRGLEAPAIRGARSEGALRGRVMGS